MDTLSIITIRKESPNPVSSDFRAIIQTLSNMFYEMIFVVNIVDHSVNFLSLSSGLAKSTEPYDFRNSSFSHIFETLTGSNSMQLQPIIDKMVQFYLKSEETAKPYLSFMTDFPFTLNEYNNLVTFKFSPLTQNENGYPINFVVSISYATGKLSDKLLVINNLTGNRKICSKDNPNWEDYQLPQLTPIEISVLALSAQGFSVNEIAIIISKAVDSVKSIRKRIFIKFDVDNITKAVVFAINNKIL